MFCVNCGEKLPSEARFCYSCGQQSGETSEHRSTQKHSLTDIKLKIHDDNFKHIVSAHSAGAAVSAVAAAVPGVGVAIANITLIGFVCSMYVRLSSYLGITLRKGFIRALATAVVSQIAVTTVARIAIGSALSLIPGIGTAGAVVLTGASAYATTMVAAELYIRIIVKLIDSGKDISDYSEQELKNMINSSMGKDEIKAAYEAATSEFKQKKASGELDNIEKAEMMDEFIDN